MTTTAGDMPGCDLVMKGGITSGVVYPPAICELAEKYRFRCIGGASAGAIAAAAAAAAERGRARGGFDKLAKVSDEVAQKLESLFQPNAKCQPLFDALLAMIDSKKDQGDRVLAALSAILIGYAPAVSVGALPAVVLAVAGALTGAGYGLWLAVALLLAIGVVAAVVARLFLALTRDVPDNFFGLCDGRTRPGRSPALCEWLTDLFDDLAGYTDFQKNPEARPLTFSDLHGADEKDPEIVLQVMTTCLAEARPYRIPFEDNRFMWREQDFEKLFPPRVVRHMKKKSNEVDGAPGYRWLPFPRDFPVVVAVRMSLSFPVLLSAVPLYLRDRTYKDVDEKKVPRLAWFSDGGICSNFPIHFFDSVWPTRPTFGITLDRFSKAHHDEQVSLPEHARQGILQTLRQSSGIGGFLATMIDSMQEWRDVMQSSLPGYRERIAIVRLKDDEGGINLSMPPDLVKQLGEYGAKAGALLRDEFSFDRHRWRRHVVWMAEIERLLERGRAVWTTAPPQGETLEAFLARYANDADQYAQPQWWRTASEQDLAEWMALAENWLERRSLREGKIPNPRVETRLAPRV
jgi:predicted acylesterase/phospholipase RssA